MSSSSFQFKDTIITKTSAPKSSEGLPPYSNTDHMVEIDWTVADGWTAPRIVPYAPLALDPTASCLHYATQCFEGLKAFRSQDGKSLRLLRPELNLARLNVSAERASLPTFDADELLKVLVKLLSIDGHFVQPGSFVYIRPYLIGTMTGLGVCAPTSVKLGIVMVLMPSWSDKPLRLYSSNPKDAVRAWPGGFGSSKLGANYGPTLREHSIAQKDGYDQVLWLFGEEERLVTEAGASNFVAVWKNAKSGAVEVVTCSLETNLILPGINRRSAIEYLRAENKTVLETKFSIDDLDKAAEEGRLLEAFAIGTAFFVAPVKEIRTPEGKSVSVPLPSLEDGSIALELRKHFSGLMYDNYTEAHPWVVVIPKDN
ncbi:uncharacterized protein SAPINGB_P004149 [Magnusiomyces paraingens]|uniref:Branched-chain-amino-acid transaminase n=1 Tax=Magnusiomyces paraingens TaxID=2606893 RepID=A0A5E8C0G2_9ASCO|nr:uncharacterized protein SAPINGB_P004149 [Saprochaete ingens]VVT54585.1 unnamed protein product [Saprochaete ingens]